MLKTLNLVFIVYFSLFGQAKSSEIKIGISEGGIFSETYYGITVLDSVLSRQIFDESDQFYYFLQENRIRFQKQQLLKNSKQNDVKEIEKLFHLSLNDVNPYSISANGEYLFITNFYRYDKPLIDLVNQISISLPKIKHTQGNISNNNYISWSPDNKYLSIAVGNLSSKQDLKPDALFLWNLETKKDILITIGNDRWVQDFDWSPDSKYIALITSSIFLDKGLINLIFTLFGQPVWHYDIFLEIYSKDGVKIKEYNLFNDFNMGTASIIWSNKK